MLVRPSKSDSKFFSILTLPNLVFLCKSSRSIPYLSSGQRSKSIWNRMRSAIINVPVEDTDGRGIDIKTWPNRVDEDGYMQFHANTQRNAKDSLRPDVIVLATGYRTEFSFLDDDYPKLSETDVRCVYKDGHVDVGFIGFVRPSIGAIPPLAELQAQFWVLRVLQHHFPAQVPRVRQADAVTSYEMDYKLHARAGVDLFARKRGVDHESYAYQLALDMGSAPTISYVFSRGWKVFFTWAFGSNFNTKFRLVGPWKWADGAEEIMSHELFDVVKRSGGFVCKCLSDERWASCRC